MISVSATVCFSNSTPVETISLSDPDDDGFYTGVCTLTEYDEYYIDVDVFDSGGHLEVQREVETFTVSDDPTTTETTTTDTDSETTTSTSGTDTSSDTVGEQLDIPLEIVLATAGDIVVCIVIIGIKLKK